MKLAAGPHYLLRAVISSGLCCTPKRTFVWAPGSPLYSTINHSSSIHLFIPLYSRDIISFLLFCTFGRIGIFTEQQIIWIFALKPTGWDVSLCVRHWLIKYEYTIYLAQKPDIDRCICSIQDRLGFRAKIEIIYEKKQNQARSQSLWLISSKSGVIKDVVSRL